MGVIYCRARDRNVDLDFEAEHIEECQMCAIETMVFTPEKLEQFRATYEANKEADSFTFDGHEFIPAYAKYLIEYLEGKYAEE